MRTLSILLAMSSSLLCATVVRAESPVSPGQMTEPSHRALGVWLGGSGFGGMADNHAGPEIGLLFENRVSPRGRVRLALARSTFDVQEYDSEGALLSRDDVTVENATVSLLELHRGRSVTGYVGGGLGVYRYTYRITRRSPPWQGGIHALAGLEFNPSRRLVVMGEVRVHAANGPQQQPVNAVMVIKTEASLGVKVRF